MIEFGGYSLSMLDALREAVARDAEYRSSRPARAKLYRRLGSFDAGRLEEYFEMEDAAARVRADALKELEYEAGYIDHLVAEMESL